MQTIGFTIPGEPGSKGRPRLGKGRTYTPAKTERYENYVKHLYHHLYGQTMLEGEITAKIIAYFSIPASKSQKVQDQMAAGLINPAKRPDCDNIAKIILDALNGIAYRDDSQVVTLSIKKRYSHEPRVEITLLYE